MVTGTSMEQALISSLSSKSGIMPFFFRDFMPISAISISDTMRSVSLPYTSSRVS